MFLIYLTWILIGGVHAQVSGLTKLDFEQLIDRVEIAYTADLTVGSKTFKIERLWNDPAAISFANEKNNHRQINITGGLARLPMMDKTSFLFVLCHEVGHFLGGYPKFVHPDWASAEGQADYFASSKCLKRVLSGDPENDHLAKFIALPEVIKARCYKQYSDADAAAVCIRSAHAAQNLGAILSQMKSQKNRYSLLRPDKNKVKTILLDYPSIQCRMDTVFQGALCAADHDEPFSDTDETQGACHERNGNQDGLRPRCWWIPQVI